MFEHSAKEELSKVAPLAARMRPKTFGDFIGQKKNNWIRFNIASESK